MAVGAYMQHSAAMKPPSSAASSPARPAAEASRAASAACCNAGRSSIAHLVRVKGGGGGEG